MITQVLIPAAGRGARLDRPGTPKPLVEVGGRPILFRLLGQFARFGVRRAVVVAGYRARTVARAVAAHPIPGLAVETVTHAAWRRGQAGSLLAARDLLDGPFGVAMADHVFDDEMVRRVVAVEPSAGGVTVLADRRSDVFDLDSAVRLRLDGGRVVAIGRGLVPHDAIDTGLFAADPALFEALEAVATRSGAELSDALGVLAGQGRLRAEVIRSGDWEDVDTPAALIQAELRLRRARRSARVHRLRAAPSAPGGASWRYVAGGPAETRMLVGRGLLRRPERAGLVPDESAGSPIVLFTDETVQRLHGRRFAATLRTAGYDVRPIVLPDGESSKSLATYVCLVERVLAHGVDERSVFVSLGGGVVCNVCGFVASTLYRGLDLCHVPTTLMAQCDAAVSHKQGINGPRGKNLVGSYYPPRLVAIDVEALRTLPDERIADGLAEAIKHALAQDPAYGDRLMGYRGSPRDLDFLEAVVRRNVELKCRLVASDPKERAEGMVLQYGHTVGHAVEHLSGYRLMHGQAIAIGMMAAARVSVILGGASASLVEAHRELLVRYGLPVAVPASIGTPDVLAALAYDKKHRVEGTRMALLADRGRLWSVDGEYGIPVPERVLADAIDSLREEGTCSRSVPWSPVRAAG